jgi:hypothetical protein
MSVKDSRVKQRSNSKDALEALGSVVAKIKIQKIEGRNLAAKDFGKTRLVS